MRPDLAEMTALYEWARDQAMLSERQRQVLELWSQGKGVRKTATMLGISTGTVETHRQRLMEKLERAILETPASDEPC